MNDLQVTAQEALDELRKLSAQAIKANKQARQFGLLEARREKSYRKAQAEQWANARLRTDVKLTQGDVENHVTGATADLRERRDYAGVMSKAMGELERTLRQNISAIQTIINMAREEMSFVRAGQESTDPPELEIPF